MNLHITDKEIQKRIRRLRYKGCANCEKRKMCEWDEQGGDGHLHFICPRWKKIGG
jgi:hypothetical protein